MGKTNFNQSKQNMKQVGSIPTDALFQIFDKSNKKPYSASIQQLLSMIGNGGSLPSIETFQILGMDITTSIVNAEEIQGYFPGENDFQEVTYIFTGEKMEFESNPGSTTLILNGIGITDGEFYFQISYFHFIDSDGSIFVHIDVNPEQKYIAFKYANNPGEGDITYELTFVSNFNKNFQTQSRTVVNGILAEDSSMVLSPKLLGTIQEEQALHANKDSVRYRYIPYQYIEVDINSAEILDIGTTPIELLPAPGVGKYYEHVISLEYTYNTSTYTPLRLEIVCGGVVAITDGGFLGALENRATVISNSNIGESISLNTNVILRGEGSSNPTNGDGTLKVKIWYRIVNFG